MEWIVEAQDRGAGEIVLNCIDQDGVRKGYDTAQLSGALAASVFHSGQIAVPDLKAYLAGAGVEVRQ
jgi:cyclase